MIPYDTLTGAKADTRHAFLDAVRAHVGEHARDFFMLPGENGHDTRLVREQFGDVVIDACERDRGKAKNQHARLDPLGVNSVFTGTVDAYISREIEHPSRPEKFDAVFLDYMGPLDDARMDSVVQFTRHLTKPRCVIALTLVKAARSGLSAPRTFDLLDRYGYLDETKGEHLLDDRRWNTPATVMGAVCGALATQVGDLKSVRLGVAREYKANPQSHPMFFGTFLIERFGS